MAASPTIGRADRAARDADAATEDLFERFYDRVYRYCLYQLGAREEAEDAAQLTFVYALRGLRRGVVPRFEAGWLFAIAKNVCLERHKSRARRREREVLQEPAALEHAAGGIEADGDDVAGLREALDRIPAHQREAVLLREWRGLSYREIAAEMRLTLPAVETLLFRARRSLAAQLTGEPDTRRRLARGFTLAPIGAALKSLFAGSAAKLGLAAAALVAAVVSGTALVWTAEPPTTPGRGSAATAPGSPQGAPPVFRPVSAGRGDSAAPSGASKRRPIRANQNVEVKDANDANAGKPHQEAPAEKVLAPAGGLVDQAGDALDPVVEPLEPVLAPVQSAAEALPATPELAGPVNADRGLQLP